MQRNNKAFLTIGQLVKKFKIYYPELSCSKLRFLEAKGLLNPSRAKNKYRIYNKSDLKKIYTILKMQKELFLPLNVIREKIELIDFENNMNVNEQVNEHEQVIGEKAIKMVENINEYNNKRLVNNNNSEINSNNYGFDRYNIINSSNILSDKTNGNVSKSRKKSNTEKLSIEKTKELREIFIKDKNYKIDEICSKIKINKEFIKDLDAEGFITIKEDEDGDHYINSEDLEIVRIASELFKFGLLPKNLKIFENSAVRQSSFLQQIIYPIVFTRKKDAYKKALKLVNKIESIFLELHERLFQKENKKFLEQYK